MSFRAVTGRFTMGKRVAKALGVRDRVALALLLLLALYLYTGVMAGSLRDSYRAEISPQVLDREGALIALLPNARDAYMVETDPSPRFKELLIATEDRFFYYHLGVNPWSTVRAFVATIAGGGRTGGSTITQQLVKNLLHNENERTLANKMRELAYAVALELHTPKEEILRMYVNVGYFGNQVEGIEWAARTYFGKTASALSDGDIVRLLAMLRLPSEAPGSAGNDAIAVRIAKRVGVGDVASYERPPRTVRESSRDSAMFEVGALIDCQGVCATTIDRELTRTIRDIVRDRLNAPSFASVKNAAVVVIEIGKVGEPNKLLAIVGSPDPHGSASGSQIDMSQRPRPIGSTWKPFIYGEAIERGARPYTMIDDSEYRYEIGTGFAFYPKNYDGIYRGPVTLHYALSNSLNVPAVRALEFVGVEAFGDFMTRELGFIPRQPLDTYQLSIALGGLEMNPLLLAHYFSIFPRDGVLAPLVVGPAVPLMIPMSGKLDGTRRIFQATTTALVNKMLSDRLMGVEQFGVASNLNLPFTNYAVKTGTTYDYHDSWTVGYTPDVVLLVWIGNSDNSPMDALSGARGAGKIWHDVMALLYAKGHVSGRALDESALTFVSTPKGNSFGLPADDIEYAQGLMRTEELVLEPHDGDILEWEEGMSVPLRATRSLEWSVNGILLGSGETIFWEPTRPGVYAITGIDPKGEKTNLNIRVVE